MNARTEEQLVLLSPGAEREMTAPAQAAAPPPTVLHQSPHGIDAERLIMYAMEKGVPIDQLERLLKMRADLMEAKARAEFNAAMARAQARIRPVFESQTNTHTRSKYADLANINDAIVPIYTAEGLSVSFNAEKSEIYENDGMKVVAYVMHASGYSRRHELELPLDSAGSQGNVNKTKVQAVGSTNSYGRRYLLRMIFNVATTDDNDGNRPEGDKDKDVGAERAAPRTEGGMPFCADEKFTKNMTAWVALVKGNARSWDDILATTKTKYRFTDAQLVKLRAAGAKV